MKISKKTLAVFLGGLLTGAIVVGIGVGIWNYGHSEDKKSAKKEPSKKVEETLETVSEPKEPEEIAETEPEKHEGDTWDKGKVYLSGDEVAYNGKIYRAKWWTQGEEPGKADVWEDTLVAADQPDNPSKKPDKDKPTVPRDDVEKREDFRVVGYFPSWKENTETIQYDVLTHINYAFAIPTAEGGLRPLENPQIAQEIIEKAHEQGVKVFIAIGGWSYQEVPLEPTFVSATETPEKRTALVNEIISLCDEYGFDGVDMDWEHPRVDGNSSAQYEALMVELAERLHAQGKQLSSAVLSGVTADGNVYYDAAAHTDKVLETVDWLNVMAYDGGDGARHSAYDFAVNCGTYWSETRGMPAGKVVLGVPFYARPSWAAYSAILEAVPDAWDKDHTDFNGMDAWYNGVATIEDKTSYALENLGGIMIWEISQDSTDEHSLQTAIGKKVKESKK